MLFHGSANIGTRMATRWANVEVIVKVMVVRVRMDKCKSTSGCKTSLVGDDVGQEESSWRISVV